MKKKIISAVIVLLMFSSLLVSCKGNKNDTSNETSDGGTEVSDRYGKERLPDVNYGGRDFRILTMANYNFYGKLVINEDDGEPVNYAAFTQTQYINEK